MNHFVFFSFLILLMHSGIFTTHASEPDWQNRLFIKKECIKCNLNKHDLRKAQLNNVML